MKSIFEKERIERWLTPDSGAQRVPTVRELSELLPGEGPIFGDDGLDFMRYHRADKDWNPTYIGYSCTRCGLVAGEPHNADEKRYDCAVCGQQLMG